MRTNKKVRKPRWWSSFDSEHKIWFNVNMVNRRIEFCYELDSEGGVYKFSLLSECRDDIQMVLNRMMSDDFIETMVVEDNRDYYTIVTNSNLVFRR